MKKMIALAGLAAILAAPAFAQTTVQSAGGTTVTSGTGVVVTPGAPAASTVVVTPGAPAVVPNAHLLPGGVVASIGSSTSVAGGPGATTTTTVTRYWVNVPRGAENDPTFLRWQHLK